MQKVLNQFKTIRLRRQSESDCAGASPFGLLLWTNARTHGHTDRRELFSRVGREERSASMTGQPAARESDSERARKTTRESERTSENAGTKIRKRKKHSGANSGGKKAKYRGPRSSLGPILDPGNTKHSSKWATGAQRQRNQCFFYKKFPFSIPFFT